MQFRHAITLSLLTLFIATTASAQKSPGEHVDDTTITARVKYELAMESVSDATDINVETSKGVVQLSGWVDSEKTKAMAGEVAKNSAGVKAVSNRLLISSGMRSAGRVLDDSILASKVKYALAESDDTSSIKINVEVRNANVELSGFVDSYEMRNAAVDLVGGIDGVEKVINSIDITPN
jgi:hyperosmotically inducible protein